MIWKCYRRLGIYRNSHLSNALKKYAIETPRGKVAHDPFPITYDTLEKDLSKLDLKNPVQQKLIQIFRLLLRIDPKILSKKPHLRVAIPGDFGRRRAVAWYFNGVEFWWYF